MDSTINPPQEPRSAFVTVLAWIFIVISSFTTLVSILQNIMINLLFPEQMQEVMQVPEGGPELPVFVEGMMNNFQLMIGIFLVISVATLVSSIGLLKRKNWARLVFIGLMGLSILWNLGGLLFQYSMVSSMPMPSDAPTEFMTHFETMTTIILVFSSAIIIGFSVLFAWIIKRLVSQEIRKEFQPAINVDD